MSTTIGIVVRWNKKRCFTGLEKRVNYIISVLYYYKILR